jgi:hypothetical protein
MIQWHFNPDYAGDEAETAFASLDSVFSLDGELMARDPQSRVLRVQVGERRYYVKRYLEGGRSLARRWFGLRDLLGPQRAIKEWENLLAFRRWGIPTATLVAYGQERRYGCFVRAALITEEICHTADMGTLARANDPRLKDRGWVAHVSGQLAAAARVMHQHGFAHNDFKWRNLLVESGERPTVHFIDCPTGSYWWRPFLGYRIIKDLACLDKVAKYSLTRTQRLRFYLDYVQRRRLTPADKRQVRRILRFFAGRE